MSNYLPDEGRKVADNDGSELNPEQGALDAFSSDAKGKLSDAEPGVREKDSFASFIRELPVLVITAVVIAFIVKWFVVQPFYIPSQSMEPTLVPKDRVLVSKFIYKFTSPKPGDVVVFIPPIPGEDRDFIKRVVAVEGDTVRVVNGKLIINGKVAKQDYEVMPGDFDNSGPEVVPKDNVFVMGDNRPNSYDSRRFGPVPEENIV
ncbi:MAG TPA: signal peptidase I, partial [Anaerolineae bacterium]|nr:signal peptidase I [Anaerolineae bacterium]